MKATVIVDGQEVSAHNVSQLSEKLAARFGICAGEVATLPWVAVVALEDAYQAGRREGLKCIPGGWGSKDLCVKHEGMPIAADGYCHFGALEARRVALKGASR